MTRNDNMPITHTDGSVSCPHCGALPLDVRLRGLEPPVLVEIVTSDAGGFGYAQRGLLPDEPRWALATCDSCGGRVSVFEPGFLD